MAKLLLSLSIFSYITVSLISAQYPGVGGRARTTPKTELLFYVPAVPGRPASVDEATTSTQDYSYVAPEDTNQGSSDDDRNGPSISPETDPRYINPQTGRYDPSLNPTSGSYDRSRSDPRYVDAAVSNNRYEDTRTQRPYDPYNREQGENQDPRYDPYGNQGERGSQGAQYNRDRYPTTTRSPYGSGGAYPSDPRLSGYDPRNDAWRQDPRQPGYDNYGQPTLKSIVLSENSIFLWWVDPLNLSGSRKKSASANTDSEVKYSVKYGKAYEATGNEKVEEVSAKELRINSLEPGTDYTFSLKVDRSGRSSGWSSPIRNRTLEQLPTNAPSNIKVDLRGNREATVSILPPAGFKGQVSSYLFLYAPSGGSGLSADRKWIEQQVSGYSYAGGPVTIPLRDLKDGEEYFYTVQAVNSRGSGPFSDIQSFRLPGYARPSPYDRPDYNRPTARPDDRFSRDRTTPPPYYPDDYTTQDPRYPPQDEETTEDYYARYPTTTEDYYNRYPTTEGRYNPYPAENPSNQPPYWGAATQGSAERPGVHAGGSASASGAWNSGGGSYAGGSASSSHGNGGSGGSGSYAGSDARGSYAGGSASSSGGYQPDASSANGPEPPSDIKIESLDDPSEVMISFTPPRSGRIHGYEIYYSYDPNAQGDLWQIETAPGDETQAIVAALTTNTNVYFKVRAKGDQGYGQFSEVVSHYVSDASSGGQESQDANRPGSNAEYNPQAVFGVISPGEGENQNDHEDDPSESKAEYGNHNNAAGGPEKSPNTSRNWR